MQMSETSTRPIFILCQKLIYLFHLLRLILDSITSTKISPTKRNGMTKKPLFKPAMSPIKPIIQGIKPYPAIPAQANKTISIVEFILKHCTASAKIVGQKQAAANPDKASKK